MRKLVLSLLALVSMAAPAAARFGMGEPLTPRGTIIESIYSQVFIAGIIVFVVVFALLAYVIIRYRASSGEGRVTHEAHRGSAKAEAAWTIIPLFVVLWVGWISYGGLLDLDEGIGADKEYDMELEIFGSQWDWLAVYEGGPDEGGFQVSASPGSTDGSVSDDNVFVVPANVPIRWSITSTDVLHSFHIADANRMTVGMVDANPLESKTDWNHMVITFSPGEYDVQCREMCFNPGHAYMRARIAAVSQAEYDDWAEYKRMAAGAEVVHDLELRVTDGNLSTQSSLDTVQGARVIAQVQNDATEDTTITVGGLDVEFTIPAGSSDRFFFDLDAPGALAISASTGGSLSLNVEDAEVVNVVLDDFFIQPDRIELEAGKVYLFNVQNEGNAPHNLFIGARVGGEMVEWNSETITSGASTSFLVTPTQSVTLKTWCDIPGHASAGMVGDLTVQ